MMVLAAPPISAATAAWLPGDSDVIVTVNIRQILKEHEGTTLVQRYLEPWRLAAERDESRLKTYYRTKDLRNTEGLTEEQFLDRVRHFRALNDWLGMDLLHDVERVSCGFKWGDAGFQVVLIEGQVVEAKVRAAARRLAPEGGIDVLPLKPHVLALVRGKVDRDALRARAGGKGKGGLPVRTRSLLDEVAGQQVAILVTRLDVHLKEAIAWLDQEVFAAPALRDTPFRAVFELLAAWVRDHGTDYSSAALGLSFGAEAVRLQVGLECRKAETAGEVRKSLGQLGLTAVLALRASGNELNRQLADVLLRARVSGKDTLAVVQTQLPYAFLRQALVAAGTDLQDRTASLARRITSIPIWGPLQPPPPGTLAVREVLDVTNRDDPQADPIRHRLDLFVPRDKKDFPIVVLVHGGAWIMGDNRCCGLYTSVGRFLAGQGVGAVLPNYRLSPGVRHPTHVQDLAKAVAWTRGHLGEYGGNTDRIYLLGHSAGGHLVSLLATDETYLKAEGLSLKDVKGVISVSGVYRIPPANVELVLAGAGKRSLRPDQLFPVRGEESRAPDWSFPGFPAEFDLFGLAFGDDPKERARASPATHVRAGLPPFLILTAANDLPGQQETADEFYQALRRAGCTAEQRQIERRNHSSIFFSAISPDDPAARTILDFIQAHR